MGIARAERTRRSHTDAPEAEPRKPKHVANKNDQLKFESN